MSGFGGMPQQNFGQSMGPGQGGFNPYGRQGFDPRRITDGPDVWAPKHPQLQRPEPAVPGIGTQMQGPRPGDDMGVPAASGGGFRLGDDTGGLPGAGRPGMRFEDMLAQGMVPSTMAPGYGQQMGPQFSVNAPPLQQQFMSTPFGVNQQHPSLMGFPMYAEAYGSKKFMGK